LNAKSLQVRSCFDFSYLNTIIIIIIDFVNILNDFLCIQNVWKMIFDNKKIIQIQMRAI